MLTIGSAVLPTAVALAASGDVFAQASSTALEEIVVTARRSEESLQSVPVTVTAFNEVDIRRKGIFNIEDIQLAALVNILGIFIRQFQW